MKLQDRSCIITGAASRISRAIAIRFARESTRIAFADLNRAATVEVVRKIEAHGGRAVAVTMDITQERQVERGVSDVVSEWGSGDVLVINAEVQIIQPLLRPIRFDIRKILIVCTRRSLVRAALRVECGGGLRFDRALRT